MPAPGVSDETPAASTPVSGDTFAHGGVVGVPPCVVPQKFTITPALPPGVNMGPRICARVTLLIPVTSILYTMVPPTTESVAEPVAVVELVSGVPIGAFARVAVKFVISDPASLSLQFPKTATAARVNPLNTTCLRMSASVHL